MRLSDVVAELESKGTAQNRKIYARHGADGEAYGVSFADLGKLKRRIGPDHELGIALWGTGRHEARILGTRVVDPGRLSARDLDAWVRDTSCPLLLDYVAEVAALGPHARKKAETWSASDDPRRSRAGWALVGWLASLDADLPDAWFEARLAEIEDRIHAAPNRTREAMNRTLILIGGRNERLREFVLAASARIGKVTVDPGDTSCKTPDAAPYVEKTWQHARAKGFESPAAQERSRPRRRC